MTVEHSSLPRIRKGLLQGLDTLLDGLRTDGTASLVLARPPLKLPPTVRATPLSIGPLPEPDPAERYQLGQRWPELRMHSVCFPNMVCVIEGQADIRIGFPPAMLERTGAVTHPNATQENHCCFLTLPAFSFLLLAPGVAYASGGQLPWEQPDSERANATFLWVHFPPGEAYCHISTMRGTDCTDHLSVQVKDASLPGLWEFLTGELTEHGPEGDEVARSLLFSLMLHLRRGIAEPSARLADGWAFWVPSHDRPPPHVLLPTNGDLEEACEYVQFNLQEALSPACIARHVGLSPTQLRRIFRNKLNTTVMEYVTQQRLEAAKVYLRRHKLSIAEISNLVGYPQAAHFSRVFNREVGISPLEYRRRNRETS